MDKHIIVRDYLESLTESEELDYLFPMLLEAMGFVILTKPTEFKGFPQYGKDIIAVGLDKSDKVKKKFYFELKGGQDRNITNKTLHKSDGIIESLREAKYRKFESYSHPKFKDLPLKIVLAHNGTIKGGAVETFEGYICDTFPETGHVAFERWGISELTQLFTQYLFNEQLLINKESVRLFKKVIVNLDTVDNVSAEYLQLLNLLFSRFTKEDYGNELSRKWKVFFESLKLIAFIIFTSSKDFNNIEIAKKHITYLVIKFWNWCLINRFDDNSKILKYFNQIYSFYTDKVLDLYFYRTLPIALMKDGLHHDNGGRYETIGYPMRTMEYLHYLCFYIEFHYDDIVQKGELTAYKNIFIKILDNNNISAKPLLDIHSNTILSVLKLLIKFDVHEAARDYLRYVMVYIQYRKDTHDILPDAANDIKNVIQFTVTRKKPPYYIDNVSFLLSMILEFVALLDMEQEYYDYKEFIEKHKIELVMFIPHGNLPKENALIKNKDFDLEELLFSVSVHEGYQADLTLDENFQEFKTKTLNSINDFNFQYRTDKAVHWQLRMLAHYWFKTPYFPDHWRKIQIIN